MYGFIDLEFGSVTDCRLYAGLLETIGAGANGSVDVKIRVLGNEL
jgi:hypothetical protein